MALQQEIQDSGEDEGGTGMRTTTTRRRSVRFHISADLLDEPEAIPAHDGRQNT